MIEHGCQALRGQIAAVVGGLGPGGRVVARRLAEEGAIVVLCDLNDGETAAVADQIAAGTYPVQGIGINATTPESVAAAFELIAQTYGDPTLLCYSIGFHLDTAIVDTPPDLWHHGLLSNLEGAWLCARELLLRLRRGLHSQATATFLLSELGPEENDALTAMTSAGYAALARSLQREGGSLGLQAGVLLCGPLPESGAERVFRQAVERRGRSWDGFLRSWDQDLGAGLTRNPDDLAEAVVQFTCRRLGPSPSGITPVPPGLKPIDPD